MSLYFTYKDNLQCKKRDPLQNWKDLFYINPKWILAFYLSHSWIYNSMALGILTYLIKLFHKFVLIQNRTNGHLFGIIIQNNTLHICPSFSPICLLGHIVSLFKPWIKVTFHTFQLVSYVLYYNTYHMCYNIVITLYIPRGCWKAEQIYQR